MRFGLEILQNSLEQLNKLIRIIFFFSLLSGTSYAYFQNSGILFFRIVSFICLLGFYLLVFFYFLNKKESPPKKQKSFLFRFYILTTFVILVYSIFKVSNLKELTTIFFHPYAFSAFFIGILFYFINTESLAFIKKKIHNLTYIIPVVSIFDIFFFNYPIMLSACFTLYFFDYIFNASIAKRNFNLTILFLTIILFTRYDYRSGILFISLFLFGNISVYFFNIFKNKLFKAFVLLGTITFSIYSFFNFETMYGAVVDSVNLSSMNTLDTRSFLFYELTSDFNISDYIIGRGYSGTYYSPYFQNWAGEDGDSANRFSIEIGIFQFLLKGGSILLFPFLMISVKSIYNGFVLSSSKSTNFLLSIWLLIELSMLIIENMPTFSVHYFMIWIIITILMKNITSHNQLK